jgi:hypothetical protein
MNKHTPRVGDDEEKCQDVENNCFNDTKHKRAWSRQQLNAVAKNVHTIQECGVQDNKSHRQELHWLPEAMPERVFVDFVHQ